MFLRPLPNVTDSLGPLLLKLKEDAPCIDIHESRIRIQIYAHACIDIRLVCHSPTSSAA